MDDTPAQFAEHWMKTRHNVNAFIRGLIQDEYDAEDVLQAVAVIAARNFSKYDPGRPFSAWVIGIARNSVSQHYREKQRDKHTFDDRLVEKIAQAHNEVADELADRMAALNICIQKLNHRGQNIIGLRYTRNMTPPAIAKQLGITATAATSLLHRIRTKLRQCIEQEITKEGRQ